MKLLVVAGEASADRLAADTLAALKRRVPHVRAFGVGGDALANEGLERVVDASELAVMGIGDVVSRLAELARLQQRLRHLAQRRGADLALLCDMPDFNLPLGHRLKRAGIPVVSMVAPQAWAWRPGRASQMRGCVDELLVLFDFEVPFFASAGVQTRLMGHPIAFEPRAPAEARRDALVLMPGSRPGELSRHLAPLLAARRALCRLSGAERVLLPVAHTLDADALARRLHAEAPGGPEVTLVPRSRPALARAALAVGVSGTATLEAAMAGAPMVVVYKARPSTWAVGRALIQTRHIAMPNILAGRTLYPELLQGDVHPEAIARAARWVLGRPGLAEALDDLRGRMRRPDGRHPAEFAAARIARRARGRAA